MSRQVSHCIYSAIRDMLHRMYGLDVAPSTIFHLLGGYTFKMKEIGSKEVPVFEMHGNKIRYRRFEEQTGILLQRVYEHDVDRAKSGVLQQLAKRRELLVFTNCYDLPYDVRNYRKHAENHLVLLTSFDEETREFLILDSKYGEVLLHEDTFWEACFHVHPRPHLLHQLYIEQRSMRSVEEINRAARRAMQLQAQEFLQSNTLDELKTLLRKVEQLDGRVRRLACEALARELQAPHGMVISRQLLSESCAFVAKDLGDKYWQLANFWQAFSIPLLRFAHGVLPVQSVLDKFDEIEAHEMACSQQLFAQLETQNA